MNVWDELCAALDRLERTDSEDRFFVRKAHTEVVDAWKAFKEAGGPRTVEKHIDFDE